MSTNEILQEAFAIIDNKITQVTFNDIAETVIDSLIRKFGKSEVGKYAGSDDKSEVNNILTHVIEVGSLKLMKDAGLIANNNVLMDRCFATAAIMSFTIAPLLKEKRVFKYTRDCYFTMDGVEILAGRIYEFCDMHLNYHKLSEQVRNDTFTIDELFSFYLGDYYVRNSVKPFSIGCNAIVSSVNYGSIASEKNLVDAMVTWGSHSFQITNTFLRVSHNNKTIFETQIQLSEQDSLYETFMGNLNSFQKFRFLKTSNSATLITKAVHNKQLFTIASVLPHGFAITYEY